VRFRCLGFALRSVAPCFQRLLRECSVLERNVDSLQRQRDRSAAAAAASSASIASSSASIASSSASFAAAAHEVAAAPPVISARPSPSSGLSPDGDGTEAGKSSSIVYVLHAEQTRSEGPTPPPSPLR
jgi:hypothetical protein